jgi:hypothetical protein
MANKVSARDGRLNSDALCEKEGCELVLECLDLQQNKNAEETSSLNSMCETCDILEREIQDGKVSLRLEVHNFCEELRSFFLQQTSRPTCNHVYNDGQLNLESKNPNKRKLQL